MKPGTYRRNAKLLSALKAAEEKLGKIKKDLRFLIREQLTHDDIEPRIRTALSGIRKYEDGKLTIADTLVHVRCHIWRFINNHFGDDEDYFLKALTGEEK